MTHSANDPDDLIRKKIDFNHITNMSHHMHVPDSITMGPNRTSAPRGLQDDRLPVRMEVPDRLRPGGNGSMVMLNETDFFTNGDQSSLMDSSPHQPSLPSSLHPVDIEPRSDDDYTSIDNVNDAQQNRQQQPVQLSDTWHIEPFGNETFSTHLGDKHLLNKLQLLQNRVHHMERNLARRDFRDRFFYTCIIGYVLLQALLSVRRSMLN